MIFSFSPCFCSPLLGTEPESIELEDAIGRAALYEGLAHLSLSQLTHSAHCIICVLRTLGGGVRPALGALSPVAHSSGYMAFRNASAHCGSSETAACRTSRLSRFSPSSLSGSCRLSLSVEEKSPNGDDGAGDPGRGVELDGDRMA